ncbi:hypothetical protein OK016_23425 [Vibrio chagasii]|nr:hypothetical protein [Vibrio chagasii]
MPPYILTSVPMWNLMTEARSGGMSLVGKQAFIGINVGLRLPMSCLRKSI